MMFLRPEIDEKVRSWIEASEDSSLFNQALASGKSSIQEQLIKEKESKE